ncbi:hypothetical protein JCGZ_15069 [Jatropha curcas]|uniref:Leucine-rich repeat-containing N-terminal plant-type domain-containing protein n=1 Tax=Jatropha curcas TaxID=180498 RepID=A0A067LLJ1_JATCU|nr:probably inactive leucine-rich repeat receptor-like protein kinase At5g48380 [Jatropha curcas]XP_020538801.1 probably inactive leucine-rich repeat receptor-like protein kinase At5g48380 [Jatropha curcas]XP_020538804.1 probably inactive leucine-rich repeat receptor-like protein kinase At5g48380 [Jatropha curcas]XP_020538807.1 probably inactive leucine-rich repeat receptor-like protein kinase At5g48380 [Jatropha curcas]KDP45204.1 hypothetical protein JCGZ_15069 [Jatropha curcas]
MLGGRVVKILMSSCLWLLLSCSLSYGTETDIACLKSIKASLEDPFGYLKSSWNFNNNTEGFICRFTGVDCWHPDENKVLNLRLSDMELKGQFPLGLRNCTSITGVDLSNNDLVGTIPTNISNITPFLTSLDLSSNSFSGTIPADLVNCSYLNVLKLDRNRFTGQIPAELSLLKRLKTFNVANNLLTGPVPNFTTSSFGADVYANNTGLCGKPLDDCPGTPKGRKD